MKYTPATINTTPVIFLNQNSNFVIALYISLTLFTKNAIANAKITTGSPVPSPYANGNKILELFSIARVVKLPKNSAALTGQNESAKIIPIKKAPKVVLFLNLSKFVLLLTDIEKFSFITSTKINPIIISNGPIILLIEFCKKFAKLGIAKSPETIIEPKIT